METHIITQPTTVHILWQTPQYAIITAGEVSYFSTQIDHNSMAHRSFRLSQIMFSVTGLEFSFTQAPTSMKSVLQALWLLTVTFGNMLVVVVEKIKIFDTQAAEFFLYAGLMGVDILLFIWLAMRYKYRKESDSADEIEIIGDANGNTGNVMDQTYTMATGMTPTVSAIHAGAVGGETVHPRSSISNSSVADEKLDESPKCLKSNGNKGVDNYGYSDI